MRVLITGCYGQVGHCLTQQLEGKESTTVLALDRDQLDITNQDSVNAIVDDFKPTIITNKPINIFVFVFKSIMVPS